MSCPQVFFSLSSNGQEVFHLPKGTLKQRIVQLLGNNYAAKIVSVQEQTDYVNITGFVGKPETAKKTRGDQYFFVNNRFIKSAYLNHAVMKAFSEMIPKDSFPMYALFIDLDPANIDINVHPTKQEIKFDDERIVYAFVESAVKHALAQFSITPSLDFELDGAIQHLDAVSKPSTSDTPSRNVSALMNTFSQKNQAHFVEKKSELKHWRDFYEPTTTAGSNAIPAADYSNNLQKQYALPKEQQHYKPLQIQLSYIAVQDEQGYLLIHQQNAHERILYERFNKAMEGNPIPTQQSLFPVQIELTAQDAIIMTELLPDLQKLGYNLLAFGQNSFAIQGAPAGLQEGNEKTAIEKMLDQYKHFSNDLKYTKREKLLRSLALQQSIKAGISLTEKEMESLCEDLFNCEIPNATPNGKPTYMSFKKTELDKIFGR
jgi:DNA mismatch repair protein MutL